MRVEWRQARRWALRGVTRSDVLLAVVVALLGQQEVWFPAQGFSMAVGPRAFVSVVYLVSALTLIWRRRAPLAVLVIVTVVLSIDYVAYGAPEGLGTLLPPVIAFYSVGRHGDARRFAVALLLSVVGLVLHEIRDPAYAFTGSTVAFWMIAVGSGFLGLLLRSRDVEVREATQRVALANLRQEERDREVKDAERSRLARELHDVIGHGLSLIVLRVVALDGALEKGDIDTARGHVATVEDATRQTLAEARRLVQVMGEGDVPAPTQPGLGDLPHLVAEVARSGAQVTLEVSGAPERVAADIGLAAYRLIQEALTNVVRHAEPAEAQVRVDIEDAELVLEVTDHGTGTGLVTKDGRGLRGMRERVAMCGGTLRAGPSADGGFCVRAALPLCLAAP